MSTKSIVNLFVEVLSDTANASEKEQFNTWINKSKKNLETFEQFKIFWERSGKAYDNYEFDTKSAQNKIIVKYGQKQRKIKLVKIRYRIAIAASVMLLIGLSWLFYNSIDSFNNILYSTLNNEIKEVILPDSSHVWLNENSVLQIAKAFNKNQRKVWLQGEAYFEVTHDKEKAFKVITGKLTTKVLGTSFNLKTYNKNTVQLTVNSGRVKFYNRFSLNEREIFTAGSMGEYTSINGQIQKMKNENINYLSWKTGVFKFSKTPLNEVCEILSSYYKINIQSTLKDPGLILTGTFQNEDIEDILSTIAITLDLEIIKPKNGEIIIQSRNH